MTEAILAHGGEAHLAQVAFSQLAYEDRAAIIAFLENLVLYRAE